MCVDLQGPMNAGRRGNRATPGNGREPARPSHGPRPGPSLARPHSPRQGRQPCSRSSQSSLAASVQCGRRRRAPTTAASMRDGHLRCKSATASTSPIRPNDRKKAAQRRSGGLPNVVRRGRPARSRSPRSGRSTCGQYPSGGVRRRRACWNTSASGRRQREQRRATRNERVGRADLHSLRRRVATRRSTAWAIPAAPTAYVSLVGRRPGPEASWQRARLLRPGAIRRDQDRLRQDGPPPSLPQTGHHEDLVLLGIVGGGRGWRSISTRYLREHPRQWFQPGAAARLCARTPAPR